MKYTLDAQDKKLGRIASEAAKLLLGKNETSFVRNAVSDNRVEIINAKKASITDKKMEETAYTFFSGHAGGLRHETMKRMTERKGIAEVFRNAVYGMLPKNKLRDQVIKHLTVTE